MNTKYIKQFEKYLDGEMDPEEKAMFEESLLNNAEKHSSFMEYQSIYEALGDQDTIDLRIKLKEIREENAKKRNSADFLGHGYNWLWLAALITVIISFTVITSLLIAKVKSDEQLAFELNPMEIEKYSALDRELLRFEQRNIDFKLESPGNSIFINRKDPLVFKWTVDSTNPLIFEVIDREGKIIFSSKKPVKSPYLIDEKLPVGMLVYRFRTAIESYHIGFMFLK
jgi:hypothetical protein